MLTFYIVIFLFDKILKYNKPHIIVRTMIRVVSKVVKCKVNDLSTCRITTKTKDIVLRAENLGYFSKRITFSAQTFYGINSIILIRQTGAHGIDNLKLTN